MNEYTAKGGVSRAHSDNGNLRDDGTRLFDYDVKNRLVAVWRKADNAPIAVYLYYPNNRRAKTTVYSQSVPGQVQKETVFLYDGWQVCEEQAGSGATELTYVYSPVYIDEPVQLVRSASHPLGSGTLYLHQNARADVVAVTDSGGQLLEKRFYDEFGRSFDEQKQPADLVGSAQGNPYGFQGRRLDPETGLYYFRNRYYDAQSGRFLQRDPVWDAGNFGGQYTFVGNGPLSRGDPLGHQGLAQRWGQFEKGYLEAAGSRAMQVVRTLEEAPGAIKRDVLAYSRNPAAYAKKAAPNVARTTYETLPASDPKELTRKALFSYATAGAELVHGDPRLAGHMKFQGDVHATEAASIVLSIPSGSVTTRSALNLLRRLGRGKRHCVTDVFSRRGPKLLRFPPGNPQLSLVRARQAAGRAGVPVARYDILRELLDYPQIPGQRGRTPFTPTTRPSPTGQKEIWIPHRGPKGRPLMRLTDQALSSPEEAVHAIAHEADHIERVLRGQTIGPQEEMLANRAAEAALQRYRRARRLGR